MKGFEMKKLQDKLKPSDPMYWQIECALQLESMKRSLQAVARKIVQAGSAPEGETKLKTRNTSRKYYAIEYIPSYPAKLDWIGREIPKDNHYDHVITAGSLIEARAKLENRLNAERAPQPTEMEVEATSFEEPRPRHRSHDLPTDICQTCFHSRSDHYAHSSNPQGRCMRAGEFISVDERNPERCHCREFQGKAHESAA